MTDQPTCGQGLAEHSSLPLSFAELTAAVAETLELHMRALDADDENSRREHAAYVKLAEQHRRIAAQLQATGAEMAGYRDLPMGRHDPTAMSSPEVADAYERFVKAERELVGLLQRRLDQDQALLEEIREAGAT